MAIPKKVLVGLFCMMTIVLYYQCTDVTTENQLSGKQLASQYCIACHALPEPGILDRTTWKDYVLPRMGYMLGIYESPEQRNELLESGEAGKRVEAAGFYPKSPIIDSLDWAKIQDYYLKEAPEKLEVIDRPEIQKELEQFSVRYPAFKLSPPSTTMVRFTKDGQIAVGDAHSKRFYLVDQELKAVNAANVGEGAVWLKESPEAFLVTVMGSFSPTDEPSGYIMALPRRAGQSPKKVITNLQRPVHSDWGDLDGDGDLDVSVSEFSKWSSSLGWYQQQPDRTFVKKQLRNRPGAIKSYIHDLNKDGHPDIVALFGQGDEGIFAYYNDGKGNFTEERLLGFSASNGSSFFNLLDYDNDGDSDIVYTAGDNADYPPILKPYHGIYLFENDGNNNFRQEFFYPMYGAYAAMPADYDQDGDLDIAAVSFFPDFEDRPEAAFLYLENQGNMDMEAQTFEGVNDSRWIVMDAADWDKDGDLDILLGGLAFEVVPKLGYVEKWVEKGVPFVLLENGLR